MKYLNKLASVFFIAALGVVTMTSCEGGDLYNIGAPDWLSEMGGDDDDDSGDEEDLPDMMEDVYTTGATDYSAGWWQVFTKYYVIPEGTKWAAQFNLHINPEAPNTYKNYAMVICNNEDRGAANYKEYGVIRYDNQPSGNSEWGDYIDRGLVESTLTFETDTDDGVQKLGGKVTLTVDRTEGGLIVKMTNGTVTKTYTQTTPLVNLNADPTDTNIRVFLVPEGSYIDWLSTSIEPIGGCTSADDKQPVSLELSGVPSEVLVGTTLEEAMANVTGTVTFAELPTPVSVTSADIQFMAIPNMDEIGSKTLIAIYNKTFKGANADKPVIATKTFAVVKELSAFTQTVVIPTPLVLGAEDNSSPFWGAHTENIKIAPKETKVATFTNYSSCANNWNNFCIVLCKADNAEYAVVRADNYGWGDGYAACTPTMEDGRDWDVWRPAMDGAKVTTYVTNNGDGTADVKAVMVGNNGVTYTQEYKGINTINPDDFYFRYTVDGCHLVFDNEVGTADCSTAFWGAHSPNIQIIGHQVCTVNFTNYSSCANNWNNFVLVLCSADGATEYAVVRADNYGWGNGYAACTPIMEDGRNWDAWRPAMNGAKVSAQIVNNGDGTADVKIVMHGTDGNDYTQDYIGINTVDPDNFYFNFTVDGSYIVFE